MWFMTLSVLSAINSCKRMHLKLTLKELPYPGNDPNDFAQTVQVSISTGNILMSGKIKVYYTSFGILIYICLKF